MTIDEAIEILQTDHTKPISYTIADFNNAYQLGLEALKCVKDNRLFGIANSVNPLPGETKD